MSLNWNQVYYFAQVAACGSLKDAAAKLALSPSNLSQHIAQLEKDLGAPLFLRQHRKLTLTPQGARLFQRSRPLLEAGERLLEAVAPQPLGAYPLGIGYVAGPSAPVVHELIGDLVARCGAVSLRPVALRRAELEKDLAEGRLDFGFTDRAPERRDLVATRLVRSPVRFYAAAERAGAALAALARELPLVVPGDAGGLRDAALAALAAEGATPCAVIAGDTALALALVTRGLAIGVLSERAIEAGKHRVVALAPAAGDEELWAVWATDAEPTPAVQAVRAGLGLS